MPSAFFLAQTAAEFHQSLPAPAQKAWMACHFSPYGTGLSNLPCALPSGSMVILNDRTPVAEHDPLQIAEQMAALVETSNTSHVLLDFQRPGERRTSEIAKAIADALPCPVGIAESYATGLDCPVFLPPQPLHMPLEEYIAPWQGRPVWLEIAPSCVAYTVTEDGCKQLACTHTGEFPHYDEPACCRYRIEVLEGTIRFILTRGAAELEQLRNRKEIDCYVGLYQDFAQPEAQATALDQCARRSSLSSSAISGVN